MSSPLCRFVNLPLTAYSDALKLQHILVHRRHRGDLPHDVFLLLEHHPVFTMGRRGGLQSLKVSKSFLEERGIAVVQAERGGDLTYHGPGQLVAYPIVHLPSRAWKITQYVEFLEEIMIRTAHDFGVRAHRHERNRGVWVGPRKLGSVGIAVRRGVTFHGLALNVDLSLEPFSWINPCGLSDVRMTSLALERNSTLKPEINLVRKSLAFHAQDVFQCRFVEVEPCTLWNNNPEDSLQ